MDFSFTADQVRFRSEVQEFCRESVTPELLERVSEAGVEHSREFHAALAEHGWLSLDFPPDYGGQGLDQVTTGIFREEMAYYGAPTMTHEVNTIIAHSVLLLGDERQKREVVVPIASGETVFCMGYTEPGHGSDLGGLRTTARLDGDEYVINGQKIFSTNASVADTMFLAARTSPDAPKHRGLSLFIVPMDIPGIEVGPLWTLAGWRVNTIYLEDVRVPAANRVGEENDGWRGLAVALDIERSGFMYVGRARRLLDELRRALDGADGRAARDLPVLARSVTEVRAARLLAYRVAWMQATGQPPNREASMSKLYATELTKRLASTAVDVLGPRTLVHGSDAGSLARGYFEENLRWSLMGTIVAGTSEIQRTIIAGRGLGLPTAA